MEHIFGIVVAAGQGTRIGFKKQYASVGGNPMWVQSVHALFAGGVQRVFVVVPKDDVEEIQTTWVECAERIQVAPLQLGVVAGGATRFHSVRNGLQAVVDQVRLEGNLRDQVEAVDAMPSAIVLVHDAARPFVASEDVEQVIHVAGHTGAAILATRCRDTVKESKDGQGIDQTIAREALWLAQTPQAFHLNLLLEAYRNWDEAATATDDAAVVEAAGHLVQLVPSTRLNLKITTLEDLDFAEWYAARIWGT